MSIMALLSGDGVVSLYDNEFCVLPIQVCCVSCHCNIHVLVSFVSMCILGPKMDGS